MSTLFRLSAAVARGFCAAFVIYVAVGGLLALALAGPYTTDQTCLPFYSTFGTVQTKCSDPLIEALWFGAVDLPRRLIAIPAVALFGYGVFILDKYDAYLSVAHESLLPSVVIALLSAIGIRAWFMHAPIMAFAVGLAMLGQVLHLSWKLATNPLFP